VSTGRHNIRPRALTSFVVATVLLPAALAGCSNRGPTGHNVILISLDTLRADRLGTYGYDRGTSPNLDALAAGGIVFENVVAESSWTLPSHVTMLSGLFPSTHGATNPSVAPGKDTRLLAEVLSTHGYRTIGRTGGGYMGREYGFDRGFDEFDDTQTKFDVLLRKAALEIVESEGDAPYFYFIHTYHVHCPYSPSPLYLSKFHSKEAEYVDTANRCGNPDYNAMKLSDAQVRYISNSYDGSILEMDEMLGRFFETLKKKGALDQTLVVVTSDHGEEFNEHGEIGHGSTLYRESLLVPLIVSGPGIEPARVVSPVGLVDVTPTILDYLGLPVQGSLEGESLRGAAKDDANSAASNTARVSELDRGVALRSAMTSDWHLITGENETDRELFDLQDDPLESRNVSQANASKTSELLSILADYERARRPLATDPAAPMVPARVKRLRALGYIE
jgi:arylsulfatase A-like enzyme